MKENKSCCVCGLTGGVCSKILKISRNYMTCHLRKNPSGTFVHEGECEVKYNKMKPLYERGR
jgi:hypothetical protein